MSQAAISAGVAARPSPSSAWSGGTADSGSARARAAVAIAALVHLDIGHLPAFGDAPGLDGVIVIDRARAAHFAQLPITRLHIAGAVDGATLQDAGRSVPHPVDIETRQTFIEHRTFKPRPLPAAPAVKGNIDLRDPATAGPGQTADIIEALIQQDLPARRRGDHRLALLNGGILPVYAVGHQVDVMHRFILGIP